MAYREMYDPGLWQIGKIQTLVYGNTETLRPYSMAKSLKKDPFRTRIAYRVHPPLTLRAITPQIAELDRLYSKLAAASQFILFHRRTAHVGQSIE